MLGVWHYEGDRDIVLLLREILGEGVIMGNVDKRNTRERVRGSGEEGREGALGVGWGAGASMAGI